jgi:tRNA G18 (ribose-2'-O)-methylase SpoU
MRDDETVQRVSVSDPADARVVDFTALTDVELRRRREPAEGLFLAEGEKVIRRAIDAGYALRGVLCEERWLEPLADVLPDDVPAYVAAPSVLEAVTGYAVHRGALASFARRPLPEPGELLRRARRVAVLEDVNDHTNVGAIFRSAAALGMDAVLLTPRCADPLYRRAVKVSMGAVLAVPYARMPWWPAGFDLLREAGFRTIALTPDPGALPLSELPADALTRVALLLGAEGDGLSGAALSGADVRVRIPMAAGVDSLNVGSAASVAFYALALASGSSSSRSATTGAESVL